MTQNCLKLLGFLVCALSPRLASAVSSAELYTSESYGYGRIEARVQYAPGDGVVSSFFMWKDGSEVAGTFWNELDFEKVGADCRLETNPIYGKPAANHSQKHALALDMCQSFHTYAYEWTPEAIVWFVDGMEIRRETGTAAQAYAENAPAGMQIRLNLWPGDATFGGNFDPAILPVHEYVDWVQFSKYEGGQFTLAWREDFDGNTLPAGWLTASWASPKNHSTHAPENVSFINGHAVLSLTADDALGPSGAMPGGVAAGGTGSMAEAGAGGAAGTMGASGTTSAAGSGVAAGGSSGAGSSMGPSLPTDGGCSVRSSASGSASTWLLALLGLWWAKRRRPPRAAVAV